MANEYLFPNTELPQKAAEFIAAKIEAAVDARGRCFCALSGGSSPQPMLIELAKRSLPWEQVILLMVDERITDDTEAQNQTMLNAFIKSIKGEKPRLISLLASESPNTLLQIANQKVSSIPEQLDIVVLGMGLDGHTASLFPDSKDYLSAMESNNRYVAVTPGEAPYQRLSMSYNWIAQAHNLILYIPGKDKLQCFHSITSTPDTISPINSLNEQIQNLLVYSSKD